MVLFGGMLLFVVVIWNECDRRLIMWSMGHMGFVENNWVLMLMHPKNDAMLRGRGICWCMGVIMEMVIFCVGNSYICLNDNLNNP